MYFKLHYSRYFFLLFLYIIFSPHNVESLDKKFEYIIEEAKYADNIVISGQGSMKFEFFRDDSLSTRTINKMREKEKNTKNGKVVFYNYRKIDINFAFYNSKIYCETKYLQNTSFGKPYIRHLLKAYNGEKTDYMALEAKGENDLIIPTGVITNKRNTINFKRYGPNYNSMTIMGNPIASFLNGDIDGKSGHIITFLFEEMIDNINCKVFSAAITDSEKIIKVWLAPSIMYRPLRIEIIDDNRVILVNNRFKLHNGNAWFPELIKKEFFDIVNNNRIIDYRHLIVINDDFKVNIELPDSLFVINFPKGLEVYDYRISKFELIE